VKISFRSNGHVDVNMLARRFRGGGHVKAAGAIVAGPMERAIDEVVGATRAAIAQARTAAARSGVDRAEVQRAEVERG
jgi:phosphoesterase RecJ-like protein